MLTFISTAVRTEIEHRLAAVERDEGIRYLMVVESGSRAWGFPSPDSDYDVRFVYLRSRDWYLDLRPGRDVIEQPITDDIDLNGWDVRKFLNLVLSSNAVASEWLSSPIRYRPDDEAVDAMRALIPMIFNPRRMAQHYASLGRGALKNRFESEGMVPIKHYFYALRPALAIRALRLMPATPPSMNLQQLVLACALSRSAELQIEDLVEAKRRTRELGNTGRFPELDTLIREELERANELPLRNKDPRALDLANRIFLELVNS